MFTYWFWNINFIKPAVDFYINLNNFKLLSNLLNFKDIVDNFSKQLFISSAMAFLCGLTQFFLSHFERSAKILRKIAVNGEKCATDSIYKGFKCGTIAGSPECWWVTTSQLLQQYILLQLFCLQNVGSLRNCNDCVHPIIFRYESTQ